MIGVKLDIPKFTCRYILVYISPPSYVTQFFLNICHTLGQGPNFSVFNTMRPHLFLQYYYDKCVLRLETPTGPSHHRLSFWSTFKLNFHHHLTWAIPSN